ncbi:acyl-CoA carboxylase subunit epsilon [Actinomadura sp. LD22]|uniref:Acyl-CoA carboxylase subunit epsilon n=1 Tax=Actinomadura physcomitrii TaxID=2650748 RepID=A0A6I4MNS2_9ACTN|nr:acyl-CoA carboxylase subunit epsilon [Actinomadura physcomitrii]MWA06630.1 acyl-CoA carboxylase subunit epsilon [Actinomadura physcomitrii]
MTAEDRPFLQVVRGDPSAAEIAALVAVLTARARAAAAARDGGEPRTSRWADRTRLVRATVSGGPRPRGPGAWRASGLPR